MANISIFSSFFKAQHKSLSNFIHRINLRLYIHVFACFIFYFYIFVCLNSVYGVIITFLFCFYAYSIFYGLICWHFLLNFIIYFRNKYPCIYLYIYVFVYYYYLFIYLFIRASDEFILYRLSYKDGYNIFRCCCIYLCVL